MPAPNPPGQQPPKAVLAAAQHLFEIGRRRVRGRAGPPGAAAIHCRRRGRRPKVPGRRREARCPRDRRPHSSRSCEVPTLPRVRVAGLGGDRGRVRTRCCQVPAPGLNPRRIPQRRAEKRMAEVTERQILAALGQVRDPDRGADIVSLGMVIGHRRSATAMSASRSRSSRSAAPASNRCARRPRQAVEALPGVLSVTAVLTAEAQAARRARRRQRAMLMPPAQPQASSAARPRGTGDHRRRVGQGRGRQIDRRRQSGAGAAGQRAQGRRARRRHLRPVDAAHARDLRPADRIGRRQDPAADGELRAQDACRSGFSCPRTRR